MKHLTSHDNPFFKELKKLAGSARQRRKAGLALLDGVHLVDACLATGGKPQQLILNAAALQDAEISALRARLDAVPQVLLDDALFAELSELKTPTGVLALIEQPRTATVQSHFCLLLEDIQDPGNLGSLLRTAAAAGCDAVFLSQGCADAWSPKVLRAGMGGHFVLNIHEHANLLAVAADFSGPIYAAALGAEQSLYDCDFSGDIGFVIGNEGAGISVELLAACMPLTIPMPGQVESLNAAAAGAICLFEAVRQRSAG